MDVKHACLLQALISLLVNGHRIPVSMPTVTAQHQFPAIGWSPKPTSSPEWPQYMAGVDLLRRQIPLATCGYLNGDPNFAYTCLAGDECAYNLGFYGNRVWGCCASTAVDANNCGFNTVCIDSGSVAAPGQYFTGTCGSSWAPYCVAVLQTISGTVLTGFACTQTPSQTVNLLQTHSSNTQGTFEPVVSSSTSTPPSATPSPSSAAFTSTISSRPIVSSSVISTPTSTTAPGGLSAGAKAGIGGGIGGAAALAIIGVLIWLLMRKKKKEKDRTSWDQTQGAPHQGAGGAYLDAQSGMSQFKPPYNPPPPKYAHQEGWAQPQGSGLPFRSYGNGEGHFEPSEMDGRTYVQPHSPDPTAGMSPVSSGSGSQLHHISPVMPAELHP